MTGCRAARRALALAALLGLPLPAAAEGGGTVRVGDHPGFGRIVFQFAGPTGFRVQADGDRVALTFDGAPSVASPGALPRNVRSIVGKPGGATVLIGPGSEVRSYAVESRVVLDVLDPPAPRTAQPLARRAGQPQPGPARQGQPSQGQPSQGQPSQGQPSQANRARARRDRARRGRDRCSRGRTRP